jgi:hypothetical protein
MENMLGNGKVDSSTVMEQKLFLMANIYILMCSTLGENM